MQTPLDAASSSDVERGKGRTPDVKEASVEEEGFPVAYYVVYAYCLCLFTAGAWTFLIPYSNSVIVGKVLGVCGLTTGLFMMTQADLIVTFLNLLRAVWKLKRNNSTYRAELIEQKKRIRQLQEAEKAIDCLDKVCYGRDGDITDELERLTATAKDGVESTIAGVLCVERPTWKEIRRGDDLELAVLMFCDIYVRAYPQIFEQFAEMRKGLEASSRWNEVQSLSLDTFKVVFSSVLFEDRAKVKDLVVRMLDAEMDAQASGKHESFQAAAYEAQFDHHSSPVTSQGQEEKPPVSQQDVWADAMEFAGVDK